MPFQKMDINLVSSVDTTISNPFQIPSWADFVGVLIPDIAAGAVSLEFMDADDATAATLLASNDTDWNPVLDPSTGNDAVICISGADPGYVDISTFVRSLDGSAWVRFKCAGAQSGTIVFNVHFKG